MFPITHTFKRKIKKKTLEINYLNASIHLALEKALVDNVLIVNSEIHFKNALFNKQSRNHFMTNVDKGYFKIDNTSGQLIYHISMKRVFYFNFFFVLMISLFFKSLLFSCLFFGVICMLTWTITVIRHSRFLNKLVNKF